MGSVNGQRCHVGIAKAAGWNLPTIDPRWASRRTRGSTLCTTWPLPGRVSRRALAAPDRSLRSLAKSRKVLAHSQMSRLCQCRENIRGTSWPIGKGASPASLADCLASRPGHKRPSFGWPVVFLDDWQRDASQTTELCSKAINQHFVRDSLRIDVGSGIFSGVLMRRYSFNRSTRRAVGQIAASCCVSHLAPGTQRNQSRRRPVYI